jgi:hypothetical protein
MILTRIERNQIYEIIALSDIDVADCGYYETADTIIFTHKSGSEFEFTVGPSVTIQRYYTVNARVFDGETPRMPHGPITLDQVVPFILAWATEIKRITETPDFWVEMQRTREMIIEIRQTDYGNTPFSKDELAEIKAQLHSITGQLKDQFELTKRQAERIDEWRDEVVEASTRMGRKDWFIYLLGTITALTIAATVPAGIGEHIFTMAIHTLGHLFTGEQPPQILA